MEIISNMHYYNICFQLLEIAIDLGNKLPMKNILIKNESNVPEVSNYVISLQSNTEGN